MSSKIGQKYKLSDFLLLNVIETEIKSFKKLDTSTGIYYFDDSDFSKIVLNSNQNYVNYTNLIETEENLDSLKCRLLISTKQLQTRFVYLTIKSTENNNFLFSKLIDLSTSTPIQVYNFENVLYTGYIDIFIPRELFELNNNIYGIIKDVLLYFDDLIDQNFVLKDIYDLESEAISVPNMQNNLVNFNLSINENKFIKIEPFVDVQGISLEKYLQDTYNSGGIISNIEIYYLINIINQQGTNETYQINNYLDNYSEINVMFDSSNLVSAISDLPLNIYATMVIKIDNLTITREKSINLNHSFRTPNEVVDNLPIENLISKVIVDRVEVINQDRITTPDSKETLKEIVKLPIPIWTNNIKTLNVELINISNKNQLIFDYLKTFNLNSEDKIYLTTDSEETGKQIISGYYTENKIIYFNTNEFHNKINVGNKYYVELQTKFNGEDKIQKLIEGEII